MEFFTMPAKKTIKGAAKKSTTTAPRKTKPKIEIDLKRVEQLASQGLTKEQIADALGISYATLNRREQDLQDLQDAIKKGKALGLEKVTNMLMEKIEAGDMTAAIFYLKTRGGWSEKNALEFTGAVKVETRPFIDIFEDE